MKNFVKLVCVLMVFSLFNECSKKSETVTSNDGSTPTDKANYKYIVFRVLCENGRGLVIYVAIFEESTRKRMEFGNTFSNGGYASVKLDINKSYRIEFYKYFGNELKCVGWVRNITYQGNPDWWSDRQEDGLSASDKVGYYAFSSCTVFSPCAESWGPG
jgi:hypothetical protein